MNLKGYTIRSHSQLEARTPEQLRAELLQFIKKIPQNAHVSARAIQNYVCCSDESQLADVLAWAATPKNCILKRTNHRLAGVDNDRFLAMRFTLPQQRPLLPRAKDTVSDEIDHRILLSAYAARSAFLNFLNGVDVRPTEPDYAFSIHIAANSMAHEVRAFPYVKELAKLYPIVAEQIGWALAMGIIEQREPLRGEWVSERVFRKVKPVDIMTRFPEDTLDDPIEPLSIDEAKTGRTITVVDEGRPVKEAV